MGSRRTESRRHWLFVPFLALAGVTLLVLTLQTFAIGQAWQGRRWNRLRISWLTDLNLATLLTFVLSTLLVLTFFAFWLPRRRRGLSLAAATAFTLAGVAILLGLGTYLPCSPSLELFMAPIGWVLELFVGGVESSPSAGAACLTSHPPAFTLARTAALLATFIGAISAAAILGRSQIDRLRVWMGSDVDVVVGLDTMSLALVKALADERRQGSRRPDWIDTRPGLFRPKPTAGNPLLRDDAPPASALRRTNSSAGERLYAAADFFTGLHRGDLRRAIAGGTRVVVFEPDQQNPLVKEARAAGAIVLADDPRRESSLRGVLSRLRRTSPGNRRLSLRRMFLVTANEQDNLTIHALVCRLLREPLAAHPHAVIPRLFVRIDDHRYARRWRLEHLADSADVRTGGNSTRTQFFSDAVSATDATTEAIVEQFIPKVEAVQWRVSKLIIVGDDPMALQLLEEVAWQRWCRFEVAAAAFRPLLTIQCGDDHEALMCIGVPESVAAAWDGRKTPLHVYPVAEPESLTGVGVQREPTDADDPELRALVRRGDLIYLHGAKSDVVSVLERLAVCARSEYDRLTSVLEQASRPALREVVLAGDNAQERVAEWERLRAPWRTWENLDVALLPLSVVAGAASWESASKDTLAAEAAALVVVEDRADYRATATRLAEQFPADFVMVRDGTTIGLEQPLASGAPYRFGGSLLRRKSAFDRSRVPVDSLARLARQQHSTYLRRWPALPSATGLAQLRAVKVTSRDWPSLPEFFQEDNVRQHRRILQWFAQGGYKWVTVTEGAAPAGVVADSLLGDLDKSEYERWRKLRISQGWFTAERDDSLRHHPDLAGYEHINQDFNHRLLIQILHRMWAMGLTVEAMTRMRRVGDVTALRLPEGHAWQTGQGDALSSREGDWWVTDDAGDSRGMSDEAFQELHQHVAESRWRRTGEVFARRVTTREIVETREGTSIASPGMWVVQSMSGDQWPVTEEALRFGYEVQELSGA